MTELTSEPPGCPVPGACSCLERTARLEARLQNADKDREADGAEIERLEAALREIEQHPLCDGFAIREIARRALEYK
jgi:hypothetical protein